MLEARVDRLEAALAHLAEAEARADERLAALSTRVDALAEAQRQTQAQLKELAAAQQRTEAQLQALTERMDALTERVDQLAQRMDALTERMDQLAQRMDQLAQSQVQVVARLDRLDARVERLDSHVGTLRGQALEDTFRDRAPSYFARLFRRIHVLTREELGRLLEDAEDRGALDPEDHEEVLRSDAVVRGRDRVTGENGYLVGEISAVVDEHDVSRALRRAEIFRRVVGAAATPVVAGEEITGIAAQLCQERGVWQVLDGGIVTPPAPS